MHPLYACINLVQSGGFFFSRKSFLERGMRGGTYLVSGYYEIHLRLFLFPMKPLCPFPSNLKSHTKQQLHGLNQAEDTNGPHISTAKGAKRLEYKGWMNLKQGGRDWPHGEGTLCALPNSPVLHLSLAFFLPLATMAAGSAGHVHHSAELVWPL